MIMKRYLRYLPLIAMPASLMAADLEVTSDITKNTVWRANTTYILKKTIFVKNGATLTIQPGTTILGDSGPGPNGVIDNGGDDTYGSLVITRGAKINAQGTATRPIVFTAKQERDGIGGNKNNKPDPAKGDGGYWGGIILLGKAPVNNYVDGTNANENDIEGFPGGSTSDITYGGTNRNDSSGIMKYVSIRFGGYVFNAATGSEINGLTFGGVGAGTTIENIEIISNTDDGFEIFGGTANTKRIAVAFCQDDSFDLDEGHQGFHQFWFAIQNANSSIGDRGGEWDGGNGSTKDGTPFNNVRVYNMTLIGDGTDVSSPNAGFFITDNFAGQVHNSVVHDFSGEAITTGSLGNNGAPLPRFFNTAWGDFVGGPGQLSTYAAAKDGNTGIGTNLGLGGISRVADGKLNPVPQTGSPLLSGSRSPFPKDAPKGFFEPAPYRGAFGATNWLDGWSWLSQNGYLPKSSGPLGPVFKVQPRSAVVALNRVTRLTANATGVTGPTTYQWFKNGKPLRGKTSNVLVIPSFKPINAGKYQVVATSGGIVRRSVIATLDRPKVTSKTSQLVLKTGTRVREPMKTNFGANRYVARGLPKGLTINRTTGLISGVPTAKGRFTVTIKISKTVGGKVRLTTVARRTIVVR